MAYFRRLGVVSLVSACWFVAVACDDEADRRPSAGDEGEGGDDGGGNAGTPSKGGSMSQGGSSSQGGKAGTPGGGDAGSETAGDAGTGTGTGGSGEGGSGVVGGAGGEAGSGEGGEGGTPAPVLKSCVAVCDAPTDCARIDASPGQCSDASVCVDPAEVCSVNEDCAPEISGWTLGCETNDDCNVDFGEICVDYGGDTWCAIAEDDTFGCEPFVTAPATLHEGGADVTVCIDPTARCHDGKCVPHCDLVGCAPEEGDTCNPVSGLCECQSGDECGTGVCVDSRCTECATDADCNAGAAATGHDICVGGKCGCSSAASCPAGDYPGATVACQ